MKLVNVCMTSFLSTIDHFSAPTQVKVLKIGIAMHFRLVRRRSWQLLWRLDKDREERRQSGNPRRRRRRRYRRKQKRAPTQPAHQPTKRQKKRNPTICRRSLPPTHLALPSHCLPYSRSCLSLSHTRGLYRHHSSGVTICRRDSVRWR